MSKGNTLKTLHFGLLAGLFAMASVALAQTPDTLIGTWKLNVERSTFIDSEGEPRDAPWLDRTWAFAVAAGGTITVTGEIVPAKGEPIVSEYTLSLDGAPVPMEDAPEGYMLTFERVDDNTFRLVTRTSLTEIVDQFEVSSDGQTMTHRAVGIELTIGRFDRQDP